MQSGPDMVRPMLWGFAEGQVCDLADIVVGTGDMLVVG